MPPGAGPLIDTKYNEFIFFDANPHPTYLAVSEEILDGLVEVVHSYIENIRALKRRADRRKAAGLPRIDPDSDTRTSNAPNTWLVDTIINGENAPGLDADRNAIRAHLIELASSDPGLPLFASIDDGKITGLTPSQVGRRTGVQALSPAQLAETAGVAPTRTKVGHLWIRLCRQGRKADLTNEHRLAAFPGELLQITLISVDRKSVV